MRRQEFQKLRDLCNRFDIDWQEWDYQAFSYDQIKTMILQKVGVETEEMEDQRYRGYESLADYYNSRAFEEKLFVPESLRLHPDFPLNCLVLQINRRYASLALSLLRVKFKGNIMTNHRNEERVFRLRSGTTTIWMMGRRETVNLILQELERHNLYVRILRNSPFRRDFLHYWHGTLYPLPRKVFKQLKKPVELKPERILIKATA